MHRISLWPIALVAMLTLAGCLDEAALGKFELRSAATSQGAMTGGPARALRNVRFAGGDVVVVAPRGYCLDRTATKARSGGGFALIAACQTLTGGVAGPDVAPAVMTVTVLPKTLGTKQPTAQEFATALAPVKVLAQEDGDGLVFLHLASGGAAFTPTSDPRHWRAAMVINGHLVTLAAYSPKGSSIAGKQGQHLILALAEALREASPSKSYAPAAPPETVSSTE